MGLKSTEKFDIMVPNPSQGFYTANSQCITLALENGS